MPTIPFDLKASEVLRMAGAVGKHLNLRDASGVARSASNAEVKEFWIDRMRSFVQEIERRTDVEAYERDRQATPFDPA